MSTETETRQDWTLTKKYQYCRKVYRLYQFEIKWKIVNYKLDIVITRFPFCTAKLEYKSFEIIISSINLIFYDTYSLFRLNCPVESLVWSHAELLAALTWPVNNVIVASSSWRLMSSDVTWHATASLPLHTCNANDISVSIHSFMNIVCNHCLVNCLWNNESFLKAISFSLKTRLFALLIYDLHSNTK